MEEEPHLDMCNSVQNGGLRQLNLYPRGHFKSTMITVGYTLQRIAENPNIRILISNVVLDTAMSFLREIKGHMERNEQYRELYGNHVSHDEKWTEKEIISALRTKNLKEPTITVAGVGKSLTGMHFDLIIGDDLENHETVNTMEQMAKTRRWFGDAMSLLDPGGQVIVIGTRYHFGDLYGHIIRGLGEEYTIQVHAAIKPDGSLLFPGRFTMAGLEALKRAQGSYMFACQYMNNPIDDENAKFKKANIKYYEEKDLEGKQLKTYYAVDRAYSLAKTADYTAHVVVSVDLDNNWYVRLALRTKEHEGNLVNRLFDNWLYFNPDRTGIEQKAYEDTIKPTLDAEMRRRNTFFRVEELKGRSSKISRIEGLVPRFESGSIYLLEGMTELEEELLRFPVSQHDDLSDALAYILDIATVPQKHFDRNLQNLISRLNNDDVYGFNRTE